MTKQDLQKELLEKVKPGTKPSDLKRSKSAEQIGLTPPVHLERSKSAEPQSFADPKYPYTTLISQQQELETLRKESEAKSTTISLLRKKIEELEKANPPNLLLQEQLAQKQKEIEQLRKQLEIKNTSADPTELGNLLDISLVSRHKNLKDWFSQYQKTKQLDQELTENINEASTELISQDQTISQLRSENRKLKHTNQSLQKDLDLAQRAVRWRQTPLLPLPSNSPWMFYTLTFCLIGAVLYLTIR